MAHRGTRSRRKEELKALDACRVLDPGSELAFTRMHLNQGMNYAKHICDRMGMSPDEPAKLLEDMQKSVALALGNPDEAIALLERHRRKE